MNRVNLETGELSGKGTGEIIRTVGDLKGVFKDEGARQAFDQKTLVYRVQTFLPVAEGQEGALGWGNTLIQPGMVADEYFMTRGHFHAKRDRGEFYMTVCGEGALIMMDENRRTWFEPMRRGSLHYIPGYTAHRVANTGNSVLCFLASWPLDAGHDYESIAHLGFSARLRRIGGSPTLVEETSRREGTGH